MLLGSNMKPSTRSSRVLVLPKSKDSPAYVGSHGGVVIMHGGSSKQCVGPSMGMGHGGHGTRGGCSSSVASLVGSGRNLAL